MTEYRDMTPEQQLTELQKTQRRHYERRNYVTEMIEQKEGADREMYENLKVQIDAAIKRNLASQNRITEKMKTDVKSC